MEVEDFEGALAAFQQVLGLDVPADTRLLAYHGTVIALLRLGRHKRALSLIGDARTLLAAWPSEPEAESEVASAREALDQAHAFASWAVEHPLQAGALRDRELKERMSTEGDPAPETPLGRAWAWPPPLRAVYRLLVSTLVTAGLAVAAAERQEMARQVLLAARLAARFDRRLERDVWWHLSRLQDQLGRDEEARISRERYEQMNGEVRSALRRRRWTN